MSAAVGEVTLVADQVYAAPGGYDLLADLYVPHGYAGARPAIIWLHGGGWRFGNRKLAPDLRRYYAERGYCMVSIDYRRSKQACFPAALEDVKTAIRWLRSVAGRYAVDSARIALFGASAGGHLAAMAAASAGLFDGSEHEGYSSDVAAVVDAYGPSDFLQMDAHRDPLGRPSDDAESIQSPPGTLSANAESLESLFLGAPIETIPDLVRAANPITYVKPGLPPFLLLHGASDTAVPLHQSLLLDAALRQAGCDVELGVIESTGHGFLNYPALDERTRRMRLTRADGNSEAITTQIFDFIGDWFDRRLGLGG